MVGAAFVARFGADNSEFKRAAMQTQQVGESALDALTRRSQVEAQKQASIWSSVQKQIGRGWDGAFRVGFQAITASIGGFATASAMVTDYASRFSSVQDEINASQGAWTRFRDDVAQDLTPFIEDTGEFARRLGEVRQKLTQMVGSVTNGRSASQLDLMSPEQARREYEQRQEGYRQDESELKRAIEDRVVDINGRLALMLAPARRPFDLEMARLTGDTAEQRRLESAERESALAPRLNEINEWAESIGNMGPEFKETAANIRGLAVGMKSAFDAVEAERERLAVETEAQRRQDALDSFGSTIEGRRIGVMEAQGRELDAKLARIDLEMTAIERQIENNPLLTDADRTTLLGQVATQRAVERAAAAAGSGRPATEGRTLAPGLGGAFLERAVFGPRVTHGRGADPDIKKAATNTEQIKRSVKKIADGGLKVKMVLG